MSVISTRRLWLLAACAVTVVTTACCPAMRPDQIPANAYPGVLRSPDALGADVMWRQKVTAKWGKAESRSFEAVLQKRGDTLTLLGLSPVGQVGFAITLKGGQGGEVKYDNRSGMELPFPPRFIILDVQRAFWPWLGPAAPKDGAREGTAPGELVEESWSGGRLQERTFRRTEGKPPGAIAVHYEGWKPGALAPAKVILNNGWFGYILIVETYSQEIF